VTIETILQAHYLPTGLAGKRSGHGSGRAALIEDLQRHYRLNVRFHLLALFALLAVIAGIAVFAYQHVRLDNRDLATVIGALAASSAAAIEILRRVTREWSQARLLVSVVKTMTEEQTTTLVTKMLEPK
jgi:hypothetical protein